MASKEEELRERIADLEGLTGHLAETIADQALELRKTRARNHYLGLTLHYEVSVNHASERAQEARGYKNGLAAAQRRIRARLVTPVEASHRPFDVGMRESAVAQVDLLRQLLVDADRIHTLRGVEYDEVLQKRSAELDAAKAAFREEFGEEL